MERASAPTYDRFKLIVTIVLLLILLLMLLRGCAINAAPASPTEAAVIPQLPEEIASLSPVVENTLVPESTETLTSSSLPNTATATPTLVEATATSPADTATPTTVSTVESEPTTAEVTATSVATQLPTSGESSACNTSLPSRLAVGQQARVLQRLNLRAEASITAPILQVNPTGTGVEVIGGPVCTPAGERAYVWWQIRLPDGTEGWSAETYLNRPGYFLEPIS